MKIKSEAWTLTSADTTAIPAGNRADGTASKWSDIWKYQIPVGQAHILKPEHKFAAYLEVVAGGGGAELGNGAGRVRIVIRDQSEGEEETIYGPALYVASKEFQDVKKMARLSLRADRKLEENFWIVIQTYDASGVDESDSYMKLETIRIRGGI